MHLSLSLVVGLLVAGHASPVSQHQLGPQDADIPSLSPAPRHKKLHGKFLHITDFHPDPFYKVHSSTEEGIACHREQGSAGVYGAETSDCDTPFSLVNATFRWIADNIRDEIDFVVWTGDSARHDSDEGVPRSAQQVLTLNNYVVSKFVETFGDENHDLTIPIVPTFGNNDILPHNILVGGPNKWLKSYTNVWHRFIPEAQRHGFERGGWFYVEVIPNKLAVFSLNTMYFFDHNSAVDGCALKSEPGFEHMEWLRIQLQFLRNRGMKAIMMGHVPPARTDSKQVWDETCWQKYTLWLNQFRDVVVGGFFGHMNIDHFLLQDTKQIDLVKMANYGFSDEPSVREHLDDELTIQGAASYLEELRESWAKLPDPKVLAFETSKSDSMEELRKKRKESGKDRDKIIKEMGGPWGERFQLTNVGPSIVPNFFPTLRVVEYNLTGLDAYSTWANSQALDAENPSASLYSPEISGMQTELNRLPWILKQHQGRLNASDAEEELDIERKKKKKKGGKKKPKDPNLVIPEPPATTSPPGPAYSPQTFSLLGYTQYYANLTKINNDFTPPDDNEKTVDGQKWNKGKHHGKHPKHKDPKPRGFKYEVEYSTFNDSKGFKLEDMTVRSYLQLAHRIAQYEPKKNSLEDLVSCEQEVTETDSQEVTGTALMSYLKWTLTSLEATVDELLGFRIFPETFTEDKADELDVETSNKEHKKKKKHRKGRKTKNRAWYVFVKRAFVAVMDDDEIKDFTMQRDGEGAVNDFDEL